MKQYVTSTHEKHLSKVLPIVEHIDRGFILIHTTAIIFYFSQKPPQELVYLQKLVISGYNHVTRHNHVVISGSSCSKLTTSLVNDTLKFILSDTQIC